MESAREESFKIVLGMYVFKHMRNHKLMNDYRRCLSAAIARNSYTSRENLIRTVLATSRPKFDVSYDYALRMMQTMVRDEKPCPLKGMRKRQMWNEFMIHVKEMLSRRRCSLADAVATVLAEKNASRYYLSYKQASKIIYHELQTRRSGCRV